MIVYSAPLPAPPSGILPNTVITKAGFADDLPDDPAERLTEFVRLQVDDMECRLREPRILDHSFDQFKGQLIAQVRVSWLSDRTRITQWVVFIARSAAEVIIATSSSAEIEFSQYHPFFAEVLNSIEAKA